MSKSARIEIRAEPELDAHISRAAQLASQSKTAFIMTAAVERADEVVASCSTTVVSPDFFDQIHEALALPVRPNEMLVKAFARRRDILSSEFA